MNISFQKILDVVKEGKNVKYLLEYFYELE